jgi:uncharacterized membrane protein
MAQEASETIVTRRAPKTRPDLQGRRSANVGAAERAVSVAIGAALIARGLKQGGLLGAIETLVGAVLVPRGVTGHCAMYAALGVTHEDAGAWSNPLGRQLHVRRSVTVMRSTQECYAFWRDLRNAPQFMSGTRSVTVRDNEWSHWQTEVPRAGLVEWESQIIDDRPDELIGWQTVGPTPFEHVGMVMFKPAAEGAARVTLDIVYSLPGGALAGVMGKFSGQDPSQHVVKSLHRFRQVMEAGETATNEGPSCRQAPAQE